MWVIRVVITVLFVVIVLILGLLVHFVTWIISKFNRKLCDNIRYGYVHGALKGVWALGGGKAKTIGLDRVPTDRTVVFIANHRSIFDVILTGAQLKKPMGYIAKIELEKIPLLNIQMRDIYCLFLNRQDNRAGLKTMLKAIDYVKHGHNMFIFPEGTRSKVEGQFGEFHPGSFKIATKPGAVIVPITIVNSGDIFEDHMPRLRRVPVVIEYGEPIDTKGMSREEIKELPERVKKIIMDTYKKNVELL